MSETPSCPECRSGKCVNCSNVAFNDKDDQVTCPCADRNHEKRQDKTGTMDDVQKAKAALLDDHNFSIGNSSGVMLEEHLNLLHFYRRGEDWVSLFKTRYFKFDYHQVSYDSESKATTIQSYNIGNTSTIY